MSDEAAVRFASVGFDRGSRTILDRLSFTIAPGEFVGVIGGNGAGKTTLLQLTLGLLQPTRGTIAIFGKTPRAARGLVGYVPQRIELDPDVPLRARDFVALGVDGERWGLPLRSKIRDAAVDAVLAAVGATRYADAPLGRLSGGEQQRLAIAQAVVGGPRLLLLDEPLANLDLRGAAEVTALVAELARARGIAVMLVAHDVNPLLRHLDRVLYLARGRAAIGPVADVITEATLSRLYDRPVDVLHVRGRIVVVAADGALG